MYTDALANRADLRSSKLAADAARTRARAAKAGFVPTVGAAFLYSNSNQNGLVPFSAFTPQPIYDPTGTTLIGSTNPTRGVSVSLVVPFFDGVVGRKGTIQEATARSEQARYAYEKKRLDLEVELRSTINAARQANEGIEVAKSGLESAQEDLKLSQEKYNVGSGTILDLLDAQVNLQKAQQQYVLALTQARVAEAQIERARGIVP
jgi:outer membrane protein TolC